MLPMAQYTGGNRPEGLQDVVKTDRVNDAHDHSAGQYQHHPAQPTPGLDHLCYEIIQEEDRWAFPRGFASGLPAAGTFFTLPSARRFSNEWNDKDFDLLPKAEQDGWYYGVGIGLVTGALAAGAIFTASIVKNPAYAALLLVPNAISAAVEAFRRVKRNNDEYIQRNFLDDGRNGPN
jgi:hypothetical protein